MEVQITKFQLAVAQVTDGYRKRWQFQGHPLEIALDGLVGRVSSFHAGKLTLTNIVVIRWI